MSPFRRPRSPEQSGNVRTLQPPGLRPQSPTNIISGSHEGTKLLKNLPWNRDNAGVRRMKAAVAVVLPLLSKATSLAAEVSRVPELSAGLSAVSDILETIQTMSATIKGVEALCAHVTELSNAMEAFHSHLRDRQPPEEVCRRLGALAEKWKDIGLTADIIKKRSRFSRFLKSNDDVAALEDLVQRIDRSISEFMLQGAFIIEETVVQLKEAMEALRKEVNAPDLERLLLPRYARKAQYDAIDVRHGCLENTRVNLLERLRQWIAQPTGDVFWINGPAGTGKTTVAYSVAKLAKEQKMPIASFFCSRSDAECSDAERIIVTLVQQLCRHHAPYKEQVEAVLQKDAGVVGSNLARQFEELIVKPLEALDEPFPRAVVIVDALDECKDKRAASTILRVLAQFISRVKNFLLFLVTSRPEPHLTAMFSRAREDSLAGATTLLLHGVELKSVLEDIRRYLVHEFEGQRGTRGLPEGWPSAQAIDTLVAMSHGLFIWAVTAARFILCTPFSHPPEQFLSLTATQHTTGSTTPKTVLELLYKQIAEAASSAIPEEYQERFRLVLGTIAVAQEPLSVDALATLLGIGDGGLVHNLLLGMHSVLRIPDDPSEPVRVIHPTFPESLLASDVPKPGAFCITASDQHLVLFSRSLAVMANLKRDIARIGDPLLLKAEVPTLAESIKKHIPQYLYYACRYWGDHLLGAAHSTRLAQVEGPFQLFLLCYFLNWLEACSLVDALDAAANALDTAQRVFQPLGDPFAELVPLIADCHRFLLTFIKCIDDAPLQVHHSALALSPIGSRVRKIYGSGLRDSVVICNGGMQDWGPCVDAFQGHGGYPVFCVTFSPDGMCFATGGRDDKITIRRSTTRTLLLSIGGHLGDVNCVAFSPDGSHIASGSDDKTVGVWRMTSGDRVYTLEGHTGEVWSVTYSQNGSRILSASRREVVLWDMSDGSCLLTLPTTGAETWQAGLSPDGGLIAHRIDSGVCLYNVVSALGTTLSLPGPARAAVFSPDGRFIAAASEMSICLWTAVDRAVVRSIDVPSSPYRLAFSRDGTQLACGLKDGSVCVWQVQPEELLRVFRGHTDRVYDVAWSPDDTQIISVSRDLNVRVWDPTHRSNGDVEQQSSTFSFPSSNSPPSTLLCGGASVDILPIPSAYNIGQLQTPPGAPSLSLHSNVPEAWDAAFSITHGVSDMDISWCVRSRNWELLTGKRHIQANWRPMAISLDFSQMAYLPEGVNTEVHICDLRTGTAAGALIGHTGDVRSVAFSSDGALLVTGSDDNTVKVWDVASTALVASHTEHTDWVLDAAFSPDDRLVISGSDDRTAQVYDIIAARITHVLQHPTTAMKVAFSADGKLVLTLDFDRNVSIWDLSQATCIHRVSLARNAWPRTLDFAPDGSSLAIRDLDGKLQTMFPIVKPSKRTWPTYSVSAGGWVTAVRPGRACRVCWLLPEWRAVVPLGGGRFCALDFDRKMSVVFDVSRTSAYARFLDDS